MTGPAGPDHDAAQRAAVGGMRTPSSASQALALAIKWLTGQMPQIRAISDGISWKSRPSANFFKAAQRDVEFGICHAAIFSQIDGDLAVPLRCASQD